LNWWRGLQFQRGKVAGGGEAYRIDPARAYADIATMLAEEAKRSDPIDFVAITTPNHMHLPAAKAALEAGFAVICDKPATTTLAQAHEMAEIVEKAGKPFALTYTYSGYPLVREARARIAAGVLGPIRKVVVEYPQGWLAKPDTGKQAEWRGDPARSGVGGCVADIGVHAFHLAEFVTGLQVTEILADLGTVVPGRRVDDDCQILLRFANGARGALLASQISVGERNGLTSASMARRQACAGVRKIPTCSGSFTMTATAKWYRQAIPASALMRCAPRGRPAATRKAISKLSPISIAISRARSAARKARWSPASPMACAAWR
jgi:hypothetical protein